jgi:hypothetical protein
LTYYGKRPAYYFLFTTKLFLVRPMPPDEIQARGGGIMKGSAGTESFPGVAKLPQPAASPG